MQAVPLVLNELVKNSLLNNAGKTALHVNGSSYTYNELHRDANRTAQAFKQYGISRKSRVGLLLPNRYEYVVSEVAIYLAGATKIPLNSMVSENDIRYILNDAEVELLVVDERFLPMIERVRNGLPKLHTVVVVGTDNMEEREAVSWEVFQAAGSEEPITVAAAPSDFSFILYTGGTTGKPKGVVHTYETTSLTFISIIIEANIQSDEKILVTTPLPHAAGLYLLSGLIKGAEIFIEDKFDVETVIRHIEDNRITYLSLVPTILYRMLDYIEDKQVDVSSIRTIQYGTAPITAERLKQGLEVFGQVFLQIYGLTETQSAATWLKKEFHSAEADNRHLLKSCGRSTIFSQVKVVDAAGQEAAPGTEGEVVVKAFTNMIGYLNQPEKTAEALKDGWLYTGDIGKMDEQGFLYLLDRAKDMIISGGMNVYCSEVENVIQEHPGVAQAAVIGVPDADWGEAVTAFVTAKSGTLEVSEVMAICKAKLSKYKCPKTIHLVDALPLTSYGKIDKKKLREPYWELAERNI
ncbi:AMP-binding protein [Planococcus shenhongbingii]|uniref:AMP-binding protein n=1 Tax=Planococcus shenhongbingii TaxID=3058398 RepID=UPI00262D3A1D|nr:AMP-binding protein [Planococcus sp. N016]WKA57775.1 AMP-binding protein [Planococcus sp. N016]